MRRPADHREVAERGRSPVRMHGHAGTRSCRWEVALMAIAVALAVGGGGWSAEGGVPPAAPPELAAGPRRAQLRRVLPLLSVTPRALGYRLVLAPRRDPDLRAQV